MAASIALFATVIVYVLRSSRGEVEQFQFHAATARYTACVLHDSHKPRHMTQLPWYAAHPVTLRSETDGAFHIILFSAVQGSLNETCFSVMGSRGGNLIQDARCYGPNIVGYDGAELSLDSGDVLTLRLNDTAVFQQRDILLDNAAKDASTRVFKRIKLALHFTHTTKKASDHFIGMARTMSPIDLQAKPVALYINDMGLFNSLFDTSMQMVDIQHCWAFESMGGSDIQVSTFVNPPLMSLTPHSLFHEGEYTNFETSIEGFMHRFVDPLAVGQEPEWASPVRSMIMVLDVLYVFLVVLGRKVNGQFPSRRFDPVRKFIGVHIIVGFILIYGGSALHAINSNLGPLYHSQDAPHNRIRHWLYIAYGACGVIHSITVMGVLNQVMGERRITIPLYAMAGVVNAYNSVYLIHDPSLERVFLLWGSVNTFVFVRFGIFFMNFTMLDWNLLYTYGLLFAAFLAYPLSLQPIYILWVLVAPILYGPFHYYVCACTGWYVEDPQDMSRRDTSYHEKFMAALGIRAAVTQINDGTGSILSLSSYSSQSSDASARKRERRSSVQSSSSAQPDLIGSARKRERRSSVQSSSSAQPDLIGTDEGVAIAV
eukprot:CAMPEP_0179355718 /NCGR_PEP_ID=MMETSP0797-20121207/77517_1 /TAXON_ID=47934 /ORGANISM="Dinophysis acuminata, Strain DAEP01" /LENGTH=598 /DNA_ID=CAMNT_0021070873 /DNA_START=23 /DNA_END=1819 /DNA_ORIENTATION=+